MTSVWNQSVTIRAVRRETGEAPEVLVARLGELLGPLSELTGIREWQFATEQHWTDDRAQMVEIVRSSPDRYSTVGG